MQRKTTHLRILYWRFLACILACNEVDVFDTCDELFVIKVAIDERVLDGGKVGLVELVPLKT